MTSKVEHRESPPLTGLATRAESFAEWRDSALARGVLPIILIAGSRGKSTVMHLIGEMLGENRRIATRSPDGVVIQGVAQEGEIEPWQRVESMLRSGELDVALWEVDWPTASTLPPEMNIATLAITNICANRDECLIYGDARLAMRSLPVLLKALPTTGTLVLNGEDFLVTDLAEGREPATLFVGQGIDSPAMETHWTAGGACAWVESAFLCIGDRRAPSRLLNQSEVGFALGGVASFEIQNALMAAAIGYAIGLRPSAISSVLRTFRCDPKVMPGSFNLTYTGGVPTIIDRPSPSWYLRPVIRALRDFRQARLLTVVGQLDGVPVEDLPEVGRLLGRVSSALFVATGRVADGYDWSPIRDGAAKNEVPPVILPFATEQAAFRKAASMARPADLIFFLSSTPESAQTTTVGRLPGDPGSPLPVSVTPGK
ncbi:MAG: hypothetical protein KF883_04335 [Thermomicrobiales bacterium]|nr:hypothetical protein [Thermomicrobiales bacterium]